MKRPDATPSLVSRLPLMALSALALLGALWAGLVRIGWQMPPIFPQLTGQHGPLMVSGFLGTLISLERAVALAGRGRAYRLAYLAPLLSGLGGAALLLGLRHPVPHWLAVLGAVGLALIFAAILRLQFDAPHLTMGVAAVLLVVGNWLWLAGRGVAAAVPWWAGFLILTVAGERLELGRVLLLGRRSRITFAAAAGLFLAGLLLTLISFDLGVRVAGAGLLALGLWLLRFDLARRTIRQTGLTRFIAACLLPGYVWLAFGGALWLLFGGHTAGPIHDALLHALFLGFVISMVFGHAPVIVPAVLRVAVPYHSSFYAHLVLLHVSLIGRVAGDLLGNQPLRMWSGLFNEIALLLFLASTARAAFVHARRPALTPPDRKAAVKQ